MKKSVALAILFFSTLAFGSAHVFADDLPYEESDDFGAEEDFKAEAGKDLVNTDISDINSKLSELERRVADIERDRRFEQDRTRQLEKDVNDLKRRF